MTHATITNRTESPHDLHTTAGLQRITAYGEITADFDDHVLTAYRNTNVLYVRELGEKIDQAQACRMPAANAKNADEWRELRTLADGIGLRYEDKWTVAQLREAVVEFTKGM